MGNSERSAARDAAGETARETDDETPGRARLDKWLWTARFYKTRSLAATAVGQGRVDVNGERAKRSKAIGVGDVVRVRQPPFEIICEVRGLSERRGPAAEAARLYEETAASQAARTALAAQLRAVKPAAYEGGRPSKKDRRDIARWERGR